MAKSILEITVASAEFDRYQEMFAKYTEQLKAQPKLWAAIAQQHQKLSQQMQFTGEAMDDEHKKLQDLAKVQDANRIHSEKSAENWLSLSKSSESFAKNLISTGSFLSKWGGLIFGGVIGGAFLGIDRATHDASSTRQQSLGLGVSPGELKAFTANYGRVVADPQSLLQSVSGMETDPSKAKPWYFLQSYGLGKMTGDTVKDTANFLDAERRFAQRTPLSYMGSLANAGGLPSGTDELRRFRGTNDAEWNQMRPGMNADIARMNTPGAKSLQDLDTQLSRNWSSVASAFETQLARAAPLLEKFSDAIARSLSGGIINMGDNIAKIAKRVQTDKAGPILGPIEDFASAALKGFKIQLGLLPNDTGEGLPIGPVLPGLKKPIASVLPVLKSAKNRLIGAPAYAEFLAQTNAAAGLPDNMLTAINRTESSGSLFPPNSSKGAIGAFQFMPKTAAELGIDPHDPWQSAVGAGRYSKTLLNDFGGDLREALAAWNWGEGNMKGLLKNHSNDWEDYVPQETRGFIDKTVKNMQVPAITVVVRAPPGFSASVAASQLTQ